MKCSIQRCMGEQRGGSVHVMKLCDISMYTEISEQSRLRITLKIFIITNIF